MSQPMRITLTSVTMIVATLLVSMMAAGSVTNNSGQSVVTGRIAYIPRTENNTPDADGKTTNLVYMKLPSLESIKLTVSHPLLNSNIGQFQWSPDASRLLFVSGIKTSSDGGKQHRDINVPWILDLRTKNLEPVVKLREDRNYIRADWLHDERRILTWVITGKDPDVAWWAGVGPIVRKGGDSRLIILDLKSKQEVTVWQSKHGYFYACSPARDEFLIWSGNYYLISADGKIRLKIKGTDTPDKMSFSPDGNKIAVYAAGKLEIIDRNTKARKVLYTKGGSTRELAWSPDGKWIAFRESQNEIVSYDPPVVDSGWTVTAVNVETKTVHEFPVEVYKQGIYSFTPDILGWTKDSRNLVLSVPEYIGEQYPVTTRDQLILCPLAGGNGVWVADIASRSFAVDWLPK